MTAHDELKPCPFCDHNCHWTSSSMDECISCEDKYCPYEVGSTRISRARLLALHNHVAESMEESRRLADLGFAPSTLGPWRKRDRALCKEQA